MLGPISTLVHSPASVGSRLASFQEESPVHKFKPKTTESVMPKIDTTTDDDDDFGDFAAPTGEYFNV